MRILFVVPYVPNLVRVRPFNLIRSLARRGHEITLATLWSKEDESTGLRALEPYCQSIIGVRVPTWRSALNSLVAVPTGQPLQAWYAWDTEFARKIEDAVRSTKNEKLFDVIHVEHLRGVKYGLYLQKRLEHTLAVRGHGESAGSHVAQGSRFPVVWDSVDCISYLFRQSSAYSQSLFHKFVTKFELGRTERYEARLLDQFARVLVTSKQDKDAFTALSNDQQPRKNIYVIPNGVDLDYFTPDSEVPRQENTVVVSGKMSYHANITMVKHLVDQIMPIVWSKKPEVQLWIVGKDPPHEISALAERGPVTVTGTVDDIRPYLRRAAIAAAPLVYGAGIQNKVLESMACGAPVIATPRAVSAIQALPGRDVCVAQDAENFAASIIDLLDNLELRNLVGEAGRNYVVNHHHWDRIAENLEEVYHGIE